MQEASSTTVLDNDLENFLDSIRKTFEIDESTEASRRNIIRGFAEKLEEKVKKGQLFHRTNGKRLEIHNICRYITDLIEEKQIKSIHNVTIWRYLDSKYYKVRNRTIQDEIKDTTSSGLDNGVSELMFSDIKNNLNKVSKFNYDNLSSENIKEIENSVNILKKKTDVYVDFNDIKSQNNVNNDNDNSNNEQKSLISLSKPPYQENMLTKEMKLLISDFHKLEKELGKIRFDDEKEEYTYYEAIRALRLFLRPFVNSKYAKDMTGWSKILEKTSEYNMGGLSKKTSARGQYYDADTGQITSMQDTRSIVKEEIRKNIDKLPKFYMDFICDFPFLVKFSQLFEKKIEPFRTYRRYVTGNNMKK